MIQALASCFLQIVSVCQIEHNLRTSSVFLVAFLPSVVERNFSVM